MMLAAETTVRVAAKTGSVKHVTEQDIKTHLSQSPEAGDSLPGEGQQGISADMLCSAVSPMSPYSCVEAPCTKTPTVVLLEVAAKTGFAIGLSASAQTTRAAKN